MRTQAWMGALSVVAVVAVLAGSHVVARQLRPDQDSSSQPPTVPTVPVANVTPPAAVQIDPDQAMRDILALRASFTADSELASEAEFATALREIIAEKHGAPQAPLPLEVAHAGELPGAAEVVAALRTASRHFDRRAAEFEARKSYEEADRARQLAESLRDESRRLDP